MEAKQTKLPKSQIEIKFELAADEFSHFFDEALEHMKKHVKVDGFREGKAPASMVEDKLKPEALLMEAGDMAVRESYTNYIKEQKLEPVGHPEVKIKKIAKGSPFEFTATVTVLPDVELPNYKEIAESVKGKEISVTEEEIKESIEYLQKTRAKFTLKNSAAEKKDFVDIEYSCPQLDQVKAAPQSGASLASPRRDKFILGDGGFMPGFEDNIVGMKDGEEKTFVIKFPNPPAGGSPRKDLAGRPSGRASPLAGKEGEFKVRVISVQKMEVSEINDEFAKQIGAFDTLVALKESVKIGITAEKTEVEKQRKRGEILEKIAEKAKMELPEILIEQEQQRLLEDLKNRVAQAFKNVTFSAQGGSASGWDEYLASIKKTEAEIKETFQKEAEKRLRGFLVLRELGKRENIEVSDKEAEEEINKNLKIEKLKNLKEIDIGQLKEYTKGVIFNEKIFQMLENLSS